MKNQLTKGTAMNHNECYEVLVSALSKCENPSDSVYILPPEHVPLHIHKLYRDRYGKGFFFYATELEVYDDGEDEYGHEYYPCEDMFYANHVSGIFEGAWSKWINTCAWAVSHDDIHGINTHIYNIYAQTAVTA